MTVLNGSDADETPETFAAFAVRIGRSRPYVSALKAKGVFGPDCFAPDGKLFPSRALRAIAEQADPARGAGGRTRLEGEGTYAHHRARKTAAEAERVELDLRARRGELLDRRLLVTTLAPRIRELRDELIAVPRDTILDPVVAADAEAAIARILETFSGRLAGIASEVEHGGAAAA